MENDINQFIESSDNVSLKEESQTETRCGYVAILGRPNVGKSTLLNKILGQKISITSKKPQTTRHQIVGVKTTDDLQVVYVDTPGLHKQEKRAVNRFMNRAAGSVIDDVDVIVFMIDARFWDEEDAWILSKLEGVKVPVILALNKVDVIKDKSKLLAMIDHVSKLYSFSHIVPLSVLKDTNVAELEKLIEGYLPKHPFMFPKDQVTDRNDEFMTAEIIREKLMRLTNQEVPYGTAVTIEEFKMKDKVLHIHAIIWVERNGQKVIVIGDKGARLKDIGKRARQDLEKLFNCKVYLNLWVKIKAGWSDDERTLMSLGF